MIRGMLIPVLLTLVCMCAAQDEAKKPEAGQGAAPAMAAPKPAPEMEKMAKAMVGTWNTTEKHEPSPWAPNGASGKGTSTFKLGPGGLSLIQEYRSTGSMGKFQGHGISWWDPEAKVFRSVWCDNMSPKGCEAGGTSKWEGDQVVGEMESEMNGQKMKMKDTISDIKPNSFNFAMDSAMGDAPMKRTMSITYTRAGGATKKTAETAKAQ